MSNHSNKKTVHSPNAEEILCAALKKFGFTFPTNDKGVEEFENVFGNTEIELPADLADGDFLSKMMDEPDTKSLPLTKPVSSLPKARIVSIKSTPTNVDYYRRTLLAAEIVHELHREMTLGHVKLQKLIFLAQKTEGMDLPVNFLKQAMGPYDPRMMRSIDKQLSEKKWYQFNPKEKLKYVPMINAGQHKVAFEKYFANELEKIHWLIETFRKAKTDIVEIISTLYACWENLLKAGQGVSDDLLISAFFSWSKEKRKFNELEVRNQIAWMKMNKLFPRPLTKY